MNPRLFAASLFVSSTFSVAQAQTPAPKPTSAKPQSVAGVSVSGLNRAQMTQRLRRELAPKLRAPLVLTAGTRRTRVQRRDVGLELDLGAMIARAERGDAFVPLQLRLDSNAATNALQRLAPQFAVDARNAVPVDGRRVRILAERNGQTLNVGGAVGRLAKVEKNVGAREVDLPTRTIAPKVTRADLQGISGRLATFSTRYNRRKINRTRNMQIAARAVDGTIVKPGETFSLNETVGERTAARGYREAIIFADGREERGLGGGVSQITGTIFNAALLAGLPIAEYRTHSRPVTYLPIGRDATVSWGSFDMKWRNNTGAPIYIVNRVSRGRVYVALLGRPTQQRVRLRVTSRRRGGAKVSAQLFRTIARDGKVVREKLGSSFYNPKSDEEE